MNDSAYQAVCDALSRQLRTDAHRFPMRAQLEDDLGVDALDRDMIALWIEEQEAVELPSDRLHALRTVGQLVRLLRAQRRVGEAEDRAERSHRLDHFVGALPHRSHARTHIETILHVRER